MLDESEEVAEEAVRQLATLQCYYHLVAWDVFLVVAVAAALPDLVVQMYHHRAVQCIVSGRDRRRDR